MEPSTAVPTNIYYYTRLGTAVAPPESDALSVTGVTTNKAPLPITDAELGAIIREAQEAALRNLLRDLDKSTLKETIINILTHS